MEMKRRKEIKSVVDVFNMICQTREKLVKYPRCSPFKLKEKRFIADTVVPGSLSPHSIYYLRLQIQGI
jgi:hypothetical protein